MSEVKTCKSTGDYVNDAIDMVYETEVEPLKARIAELKQMVREFMSNCKYCIRITNDGYALGRRCGICSKAIALLQPEAGREVGR